MERPARILFLDDSTDRHRMFLDQYPHAVCVTTADETIQRLADLWDLVSLDHDLGGEIYVDSDRRDTGMEVVRWIENNRPGIREVVVHSLNQPAANEMVRRLKDAGYRTRWRPFGIEGFRGSEEPQG